MMCELNNVKELKDLFEIWKKKHEKDSDYLKSSFCPDGFLGDREHDAEILFICKESNVSESIESGGEMNDTFYMKKVINCEAELKKYKNCLENLAIRFGKDIFNCAYMNINKRGGKERCDDERLKNYANEYEEYIKKEIELINPKQIIILGSMPDEVIKIIKVTKKADVDMYRYRHPSVYWKKEIDEDTEKHKIK